MDETAASLHYEMFANIAHCNTLAPNGRFAIIDFCGAVAALNADRMCDAYKFDLIRLAWLRLEIFRAQFVIVCA